ncbi:MAG: hypothetical protein ACR2HF_09785, partial [Methylococcaceae bacterium]
MKTDKLFFIVPRSCVGNAYGDYLDQSGYAFPHRSMGTSVLEDLIHQEELSPNLALLLHRLRGRSDVVNHKNPAQHQKLMPTCLLVGQPLV